MAIQDTLLTNAAVQAGLIDAAALPALRVQARREHCSLVDLLCRSGHFPVSALYRAIAGQFGLPYLERSEFVLRPALLDSLNGALLLRRLFLPVEVAGELVVLVADPDNRAALETVQRTVNQPVTLAMTEPLLIETELRRHYAMPDTELTAITLFDRIMCESWLRKATDLHFEALEQGMQLRMRVDGQMQTCYYPLHRGLAEALMSRLKVLAGLDIAEQFNAQDGGFAYRIQCWAGMDEIEMRVATLPTRWGERATLRVLGQETASLSLTELGMPPAILAAVQQAVRKPHGMLLVTGPTGSGKSTTLYAALRELDAAQQNIMTVEDPIEQMVEGISQVQVSDKLSFAAALRSFLRHDPDVMLVGEVRDHETAETAVRAAMTGHLVLSTLHTNNAASTVSRLVDIGCARFLIAGTLVGVLAQRLLRRLCPHCSREVEADAHQLGLLQCNESTLLREPVGCVRCMGSGYRGRVGIYELLQLNNELSQLIHRGVNDHELAQAAQQQGMLSSLWQDARAKVLDGVTSLQEALQLYQDCHDGEF